MKAKKEIVPRKAGTVLITGQNGFIGRNLAGYLHQLGYKVANFDRSLFYDANALTEYIKEANPQFIFHLSAYGNHNTQKDPNETMFANVVSTYTLLAASKDIPYEGFVNVSTSSVYGESATEMKETSPLRTNNFYGCTKVAAEYISRAFAHDLKKPIVTLRPFSVYGPGEADHRFIPTVIRSIIQKEKLDLYTDPVHDWLYVEDFCDAMLKAALNAKELAGYSVNVGTSRQYTNYEVYKIITQLMYSEPKIREIKGKARDYESKVWKAEISTMRLFDWKPRFSIEEGLMECINYYKFRYSPSPLKTYVESTTELIESVA